MDHPPDAVPGEVTRLLARVQAGDRDAVDRLFPMVYGELRAAADRALRGERPGHTLQPTALVHEAYLKLAGGELEAKSRGHFVALAARAMRQILVDHARRKQAAKRGGGVPLVSLPDSAAVQELPAEELIALDDALTRLSAFNERLRNVVELRYFAGLTEDEAAQTLGVTTRTVQRDWAKARAWLYREMYGTDG